MLWNSIIASCSCLGGAEQPGVGVPLRGPKPAVAAPPIAQVPPRVVAVPMSDDRMFQGAKQAIRIAAAQPKQQQQNPPPYINQKDAVEVSLCLPYQKVNLHICVASKICRRSPPAENTQKKLPRLRQSASTGFDAENSPPNRMAAAVHGLLIVK